MNNINVLHFSIIDSTSTYLIKHFNEVEDFTFVVADYQTKGHGRNKRKWYGDKKQNLLFSFIIKDKKIIENYSHLSLATAYLISSFLKTYFQIDSLIKWPNDVFTELGKICGILLETHMNEHNEIDGIIVGVGLNVNQVNFSVSTMYPASSIRMFNKKEENITDFSSKLFFFIKQYLKGDNFLHHEHIKYIKEHNFFTNKKLDFMLKENKQHIQIIDINDDCSLKIKVGDEIRNLFSGEIIFHCPKM